MIWGQPCGRLFFWPDPEVCGLRPGSGSLWHAAQVDENLPVVAFEVICSEGQKELKGNISTLTSAKPSLAVFVLTAFFNEIPEELWGAAKVDGASNFQIFRKVILPLTIPGIFTCAILVFIAAWNELLFAQIFLSSDVNHTIPRAILRFVFNDLSLQAPWDTGIVLLAATSLATVPLVIVVLIFQKKIISGLTRGAVKG